jgi:hypothetical protein
MLDDNDDRPCDFAQGLAVLRTIEAVETAGENQTWVRR